MAIKSTTRKIPDAPKGKEMLKWLGPGFLWMVSAAGSGELLFTPRVGSMYGYTLLWALLAAVVLKWFINREIGRYAVCTGSSVIDGFAKLPGPRNLALWFILVPQLFVAVISIAGLGGGAATALILLLPGNPTFWMIVSVLLAATLVLWGKYKGVEKTSVILASVLSLASIVAAISISPSLEKLAAGLKPTIPDNVNLAEILPWLGFMMSGAAGMMWYSYWIPAKGYAREKGLKEEQDDEQKSHQKDLKGISKSDIKKLTGWIRQMSLDNSTAVIGTLIITISFLILGTEVLQPKGLVPEENKMASTLGMLLGELWGPIGFWFMVVGVFIGFWDTVLSDQDGHSRLFANGSLYLLPVKSKRRKWMNEKFLKRLFIITLVTILPIIIYVLIGNPLQLLKIAGAIEAAHIPVVTGLVLYLNFKTLPKELQPSRVVFFITATAGLFFAAFAIFYLLELTGLLDLQ